MRPTLPYTFTTIDVSGATHNVALGINGCGQIVGWYLDANGEGHGYLLDKGQFTTIDAPGASFTQPNRINLLGQIVGEQMSSEGIRGFLFDSGHFTTIEIPESLLTIAAGINTRGQIVGLFNTFDDPRQRGFLATPIPQRRQPR